jgi:hypothetical protein
LSNAIEIVNTLYTSVGKSGKIGTPLSFPIRKTTFVFGFCKGTTILIRLVKGVRGFMLKIVIYPVILAPST